MSPQALQQLRNGFAAATAKLKAVNDFITELSSVTEPDDFELQEWVVRARLLRGMSPPMHGDTHMLAWNTDWRPYKLPEWFKKACRHFLMSKKLWIPYRDPMQLMMSTQHDYRVLFNHIGSIDKGPMRPVVLQPYGNYDATATEFAKLIGVKLEIIRPGIWQQDTTTYVFRYGV